MEEGEEKPRGASARTIAKEALFSRQRSYLKTFDRTSDMDRAVLEDLARFCRANESCFHPDPRAHAVLEGRREVFLRILDHIDLSSQELYTKYVEKKGR